MCACLQSVTWATGGLLPHWRASGSQYSNLLPTFLDLGGAFPVQTLTASFRSLIWPTVPPEAAPPFPVVGAFFEMIVRVPSMAVRTLLPFASVVIPSETTVCSQLSGLMMTRRP